jgi:predicted unusual protein kinase regulating ubiquinone biosynthesis (AarF/ABC1/UbiB family)
MAMQRRDSARRIGLGLGLATAVLIDVGGPPRGGLTRAGRLVALPVTQAGRTALGLGMRLGGRPAGAVTAQVQQRTAEHLFATLGELKGGAMKLGQALSAVEAALPEQLAGPYHEAFTRLQEAAPALPATVVHRVLDESFPAGWRHLFRQFDDRPAAAASIGQVHRACWRDGTPVAVKVQYPGVAEALITDLNNLARLAPLLNLLVPGLDIGSMVIELRNGMVEELDYVREAEGQAVFAHAFRDDPDIFVPEVLAVQGRVIVSSWCDGTPLSRVIEQGTQAERDHAGRLLVRLVLSSPERAGRLHGDPHPGNFRVLPDGRLGVLDFGCTAALPDGWPTGLGALLRAGRDGDATALRRIAVSNDLIRVGGASADELLDVVGPNLEPLQSPVFRFQRSWFRDQVRRGADPRNAAARTQRHLGVPPEHTLLHRVAVGLAGMLCLLDATVAVDDELRRWMPGYE